MRLAWPALVLVACHGGREGHRKVAVGGGDAVAATDLDARSAPSGCGNGWDVGLPLWATVKKALATAISSDPAARLDDRVTAAFQDLRRRDPGLGARVVDAGGDRRAVVATYECGALALGGRLWLLSTRADARWEITDELQAPDGEHATLLAPAAGVLALVGTRWGTQYNVFSLQLVHADGERWNTLFSRTGMIELAARQHGAPTFAWGEAPKAFGEAMGTPLRTFELRLDSAPRVTVVSTTPWLEALDAWCATSTAPRRQVGLCNPDTHVQAVRAIGPFAAATLSGPRSDVDCRGEAPGSWIAADRATVVELGADQGGTWRVIDVRSEDRGCATTVRPLNGSRARTVSRGRDNGNATIRDGHAVWTRSERMLRDGVPVVRLNDTARAIALGDGGLVYWVSAETGRLRRLAPGGDATTLSEPIDPADGLAVVGGAVYWSSYTTGKIFTHEGARTRIVADGLDRPWGIAAQRDALLVATATGIRRVDLTTGQVVDVDVPALAPLAVATSGDAVAWTEAGGRVMLAATGQDARVLATGGRPLTLGIDDHAVVWADASDGTIRRAAW